MSNLELLFLGTGTSAGVPMIGCTCGVCSSGDPRDKRMRPSVAISYHGKRIIVDTTPELRLQCVAHGVNSADAIVYTHGHADHIMGLDDVRRFNTLRQGSLDVWSDPRTRDILLRAFGYAFQEPSPDPGVYRPHLVHRLIEGPFEIEGVTWTPVPLYHGPALIFGYRIGKLAYLTDVNRIPEESFELLKDLDVLVLDALQYKRHTTHFSVEQALEAAGRIGARRTYFTHIAHALGHEATNATFPENIRLAYDGLRVTAPL